MALSLFTKISLLYLVRSIARMVSFGLLILIVMVMIFPIGITGYLRKLLLRQEKEVPRIDPVLKKSPEVQG